MTNFKVLRDGGRIDCGWREVYSGPEGQVLAKVTAPRLRTRW